jgi:sulfite reductase alpha subunit-like flavoprotein
MDNRVDLFVEPLSLLASELMDIASRIQNLQDSHSARMETAASRLQDILREQITANLKQRLDCEFQEGTRVIRAEFEERIRVATQQWAAERQSMQNQIASLRGSADRPELQLEIAQTEKAIFELRSRIETMVDDPTVALSKLVQASARESELHAYLKGLKFKLDVLAPRANASDEGVEPDDTPEGGAGATIRLAVHNVKR